MVVVVVADIYLVYLSLLLSLTCNLFYFVQHQSGRRRTTSEGRRDRTFGHPNPDRRRELQMAAVVI